MLVITNCMAQNADEGCLKVAASLVKRLKAQNPKITVVGYERENPLCDVFLPLNKWMLSGKLCKLLRQKKQPVLFAPFSARMHSNALRTFVISLFSRGQVYLLNPMYAKMTCLAKFLMRLSGAKLICVSQSTYDDYRAHLADRVIYLRTGVDTQRFTPVDPEEKKRLKRKYGLPEDRPIVLHVGHMKPGRNVGQFQKLSPDFHGLLVLSTHTPLEQDGALQETLSQQENMTVITGFQPEIQEFYQLADVYLFPVEEKKSCIDVPLSALEAAACGIPVVTTPFREMQSLIGKPGFYEITSFEPQSLNALLQKAAREQENPRDSVSPYDWDIAVEFLLKTEEERI